MIDLTIALGDYAHTRPLKDGRVHIDGVNARFIEHPSILTAARSMCRNGDYDIAEMPLTTYLVARSAGKPFTALPVFLVRVLPQFLMFANRDLVSEPSDLRGQRVGVRAYTVTAGVWSRIVLRTDHSVDPGSVTWVAADDEHVLEYERPGNVELQKGAPLGEMLNSGELAAVLGVDLDLASLPNVDTLFSEPEQAAMSWLQRGLPYPLNHTVTLRDEVVERNPGVGPALFEALEEAKRISATDPQEAIASTGNTRQNERVFAQKVLDEHPIHYGLESNREALQLLLDHAVEQKLLSGRPALDEFFIRS